MSPESEKVWPWATSVATEMSWLVGRAEAIDDVDVQRGVGVLVVVVGVELDRDAGQDRVRDRLGSGRRRPNLGADAVVVAIVLVENDSVEAVDVRIERRKHCPVVERDGERVVELPRVARFGEDVKVHRRKHKLLDGDRLRAQLDVDPMRGVVVEGLALARVDGAAEIGILAEPVGVVILVGLKVRDKGGRAFGIRGVVASVLDEDMEQRVVVQVVVVGVKIDGDRLNDRPGVVAEVGEHESGGLKAVVAIVQGDPDAGVAEADDIGLVVAVQVREVAGMERNSPSLIVAEPGERPASCRFRRSPTSQTPASPKPTRSALPSPVTSAAKRGWFSMRQPWL